MIVYFKEISPGDITLSISTKIPVYSTCALAVLLYGSETWTLTQPEWEAIGFFPHTMSHQMAGLCYQ